MRIWALQFSVILLAILLPHLLDVGYSLTSFETLVVGAIAIALSLLFAAITVRSRELGFFSLAFLGYWLVDSYFISIDVIAIVVLPILYFSLRSAWGEGVRRGMGAFAVVFLMASIVSYKGTILDTPLLTTPTGSNLTPLFLHVIIDENASHAAMAEIHPALAANRLLEDYTDRGFTVFESTRATSGSTVRSLTAAFEGEVDRNRGQFSYSILNASYPRVLGELGYEVAVIQSNFLELCDPKTASCHTYNRNTNGRQMARFGSLDGGRLRIAADVLRAGYLSAKSVRGIALFRALGFGTMDGRIVFPRPATMLGLLDELESHFSTSRDGEAYLIHLMLPHFPYVLDSECGLTERDRWVVLDLLSGEIPPHLSADLIEQAYAEQVLCTHARIIQLIDVINASNPDAIILIQGDHGLRLDSMHHVPEPEEMSSPDAQRHLDLLFTLRAPWIEQGIVSRIDTLPDRLRATVINCLSQAELACGPSP